MSEMTNGLLSPGNPFRTDHGLGGTNRNSLSASADYGFSRSASRTDAAGCFSDETAGFRTCTAQYDGDERPLFYSADISHRPGSNHGITVESTARDPGVQSPRHRSPFIPSVAAALAPVPLPFTGT